MPLAVPGTCKKNCNKLDKQALVTSRPHDPGVITTDLNCHVLFTYQYSYVGRYPLQPRLTLFLVGGGGCNRGWSLEGSSRITSHRLVSVIRGLVNCRASVRKQWCS